jgi:hypothetical protein
MSHGWLSPVEMKLHHTGVIDRASIHPETVTDNCVLAFRLTHQSGADLEETTPGPEGSRPEPQLAMWLPRRCLDLDVNAGRETQFI